MKAAGLDPEKPPRTWDEFADWCRKLTFADKTIPGATVQRGQRAFAIENRPWGFLPWVGAAGGDVIRMTNDERRMTNGGEKWEACFDSPESLRAAKFLQGLIADGVVRALPQLSMSNEVADMFVNGEIVSVFGGEDLVVYLTEPRPMSTARATP